jgi:transketolase
VLAVPPVAPLAWGGAGIWILGRVPGMALDAIDTDARAALEAEAVTTLRMLALDEIDQARSGHPGIALGLAPVAWVVATRLLRYDPYDPTWVARDRLVLSAGHGSALLYALLHLLGYDLGVDDLARFRQLGSRTPGHPEIGRTPGVEVTTGPLGQGLATAVGLALGARRLGALTEGAVSSAVYVLASDGDLLEGISHEAAALAGQLGLGNLIVGWDANGITIDGPLAASSCTDERARFASYGWQVLEVVDPEDLDEVEAVLREARRNEAQPTLVVCPTLIGRGVAGLEGTPAVHGAPLARDALQLERLNINKK